MYRAIILFAKDVVFFINGAYFSFIDEAMTLVQMKTSSMKLIYVQPSSKSMILPSRDDLSDNIGHTVWCKTLRLCFVLYRRSKKFWIEMCRNLTTLFSLYINRFGILSFFFLQCLPLHILRLYIVWRTCNSEFMWESWGLFIYFTFKGACSCSTDVNTIFFAQ